ncbi:carbohydrate ABC transporter permease [Actinomyces faecalis]|uniref:carbohydrate ABC transporter permease n=1 Tax=Actinomyces faecalis TaxID=2722820 RepID=UPI001557B324|nr:carbohydrate ABC transporter permease [Actinomyces faecalis]
MKATHIAWIAKYATLIFLVSIWLYPIGLAIWKSTAVGGWGNYKEVLTHDQFNYWQAVGNSFLMAGASTILVIVISSLGGYAFSKMQFRGRTLIYNMLMACMAVSIASVVTPLFASVNRLGLRDTQLGVIIPMVAFNTLMMLMIMKTHFDSLPDELIEAALIDGCGSFKIFRSVLLPLSGSPMATVGVLTFVYTWNEYLLPLLLMKSENIFPVTRAISLLQFDKMSQHDISVLYAGLILMTLPTLVVYLFSQKYLQAGITAGAVKS